MTGISGGGGGFGTVDDDADEEPEFILEVGTGNPGRGEAPARNERKNHIDMCSYFMDSLLQQQSAERSR